jgi:hypothetical protein
LYSTKASRASDLSKKDAKAVTSRRSAAALMARIAAFCQKGCPKRAGASAKKKAKSRQKNENKRCASFAVRKSPVAVTGLCAVKLSISYLLWQN